MDARLYVRNVVCIINARVWRYVCNYLGFMYSNYVHMNLCMSVYKCLIYVCMFLNYRWLRMFLHTHLCVCVCLRACVCAF